MWKIAENRRKSQKIGGNWRKLRQQNYRSKENWQQHGKDVCVTSEQSWGLLQLSNLCSTICCKYLPPKRQITEKNRKGKTLPWLWVFHHHLLGAFCGIESGWVNGQQGRRMHGFPPLCINKFTRRNETGNRRRHFNGLWTCAFPQYVMQFSSHFFDSRVRQSDFIPFFVAFFTIHSVFSCVMLFLIFFVYLFLLGKFLVANASTWIHLLAIDAIDLFAIANTTGK